MTGGQKKEKRRTERDLRPEDASDNTKPAPRGRDGEKRREKTVFAAPITFPAYP